ncbi:uncharacterized protein LOC110451947 [Mizuhopecten yessoensis]|uniref:Inositol 1,4,5-trisphosphate receptor-interacting protein n=1 Tax=Mizuhopecten yessoensis TaxID=6573 RepID=A0A210QKT0_MIZYE|nr:uncharacterized protein LOC110451947 [Mizuhopecten yessoensis]XP_021355858.1 uncharacterized protein LOC110451947 [Mizuhopecten yessoensis]XP_021355860.1 uncharacterized protein LOC110451947 [Mizuhopecten yessoensis]OWF49347.1 Inositol 1,4,5-trisphosphate receptor-interacting protein [Mizuhopecten yessoensis]
MISDITRGVFNSTNFYKVFVKVNLWFCTINHDPSRQVDGSQHTNNTSLWDVGNEFLSEAIQYMFSANKAVSVDRPRPSDDGTYCEKKFDSINEHRVPVALLLAVLIATVCVVFTSLFIFICWRVRRNRFRSNKVVTIVDFKPTDEDQQSTTVLTDDSHNENDRYQTKCELYDEYRTGKFKGILLVFPTYIQPRKNGGNLHSSESEISWFLKNSVDYVFSELDKYLLDRASLNSPTSNGPSTSLADHMTSPRLTTRRVVPRSRQGRGSSPQLTQHDRVDEPSERRAWQEFQQKVIPLGKFPYHNDAYRNTDKIADTKVRNLIQFYNAQCVVRFEQWNGACLIANYTLILLEKAMKTLNIDASGMSFNRLEMTGSIMKGLKSSTAGQFDVLMIFQGCGFKVAQALDQISSTNIPPGKLVLTAEQTRDQPNECLKNCNLDNDNFLCVSSEELVSVTESMLDKGIQKIYTETRSLIDRLPFRIQRSATASLTLSLDTRNVVGLNLPEIKLQIIPAIPLHAGGWYQLSTVYAVPPWHVQDVKRKALSRGGGANQACSHDLLWSLSLGELEKAFFGGFDKKMETAGVTSCHIICLTILKTLFTSVTRRSLLDRGEINSYILETVISFLLLESLPSDWTLDKLADRFSDSIHFLRSAMEHGRLPNFFLHNPHLLKQMPALKTYPFLTKGRQENLLADSRQDTTEKTFKFMNHRLKEMKMEDCVKGDYSEELWEYEFFVFN